jgi:twitching motility protein PilT
MVGYAMDLDSILRRAVDLGASDVHLKLGQPPVIRIDGDLEPLPETPPLAEADLEAALGTVTGLSPRRREMFEESGDLDIA